MLPGLKYYRQDADGSFIAIPADIHTSDADNMRINREAREEAEALRAGGYRLNGCSSKKAVANKIEPRIGALYAAGNVATGLGIVIVILSCLFAVSGALDKDDSVRGAGITGLGFGFLLIALGLALTLAEDLLDNVATKHAMLKP